MFSQAGKEHANNTHARNQNLNDTDSLEDLNKPVFKELLLSNDSADKSR